MEIDVYSANILDRRVTKNDQIYGRQQELWEAENNPHLRYIMAAMAEIDPKYTRRLVEQGDRVQNNLEKDIENVEYRRQGSVTNNTHIRANSDVDVLVITEKFHTIQLPNKPLYPYTGDSMQDILTLRGECVRSLDSRFPQATVDNSGSYSVAIEGGSLLCKVDVVPSNWFHSVNYENTYSEIYRGIRVLDKDTLIFSENYPFLTNSRLDQKDNEHLGKVRRTIRLLKVIKVDADNDIALSSYDICSLIYRISDTAFQYDDSVMGTISQLLQGLLKVSDDQEYRDSLMVIDDSRRIFDKVEKIRSLNDSILYLYQLYKKAKDPVAA